jgi:hypothetical protein
MNYIKQLSAFFEIAEKDSRLTPFHISLYLALFRRWNLNYFNNPVSIARDEMMRMSKIGSLNTYVRILKELNYWDYVRYTPSHNKHKGSLVYMYTFDTTCDTTSVQDVSPLINNINITNNKNIEGHPQNLSKIDLIMKNANSIIQENPPVVLKNEKSTSFVKNKKENVPAESYPPSLDHLVIYFNEKGKSALEAEKFFNHFESNGWLVGGRAKMKDWKAAARNWILNIPKFEPRHQPNKTRATTLNASKNYNEPL